ncbi:hypothetical protein B0T18DRAFT_2366 [Schizothecium vesticola]|uniref:Uncharacterized protein n=1 Tax=Schizothecium vesticola TaxID=314040 RepID=A0AA40F7R9_9PEZI|nr:hypothetical protein B0T18DRAFT_2366 [Schizothecium vesticola]
MGGVQLETLGQSAFQQHGPWRVSDSVSSTSHVDLGAAFLGAAFPVLNGQYCEWPRAKITVQYPASSPEITTTAAQVRSLLSTGTAEPEKPAEPLPLPETIPLITNPAEEKNEDASPYLALPFGYSPPAGHTFALPIREPQTLQPDRKRCRADTDVDGFNTAPLSCKKRRLLRTLITSRLSRPFSLPATHVLNREAATPGDKRFMRLAAMAAARRIGPAGVILPPPPPPPSQSSMMRRQALINSSRARLQREMAERVEASAGANWGASSARGDAEDEGAADSTPCSFPPASAPRLQRPFRASPPGSPVGLRPSDPKIRLPPSPRMRPLRSPELRTTRPLIDLDDLEDLDDESVAFPTSEHESRYDDEPDDVYADFGVIFGGGEGGSLDDELEEDFYEDYLDDVDGIPWNARC